MLQRSSYKLFPSLRKTATRGMLVSVMMDPRVRVNAERAGALVTGDLGVTWVLPRARHPTADAITPLPSRHQVVVGPDFKSGCSRPGPKQVIIWTQSKKPQCIVTQRQFVLIRFGSPLSVINASFAEVALAVRASAAATTLCSDQVGYALVLSRRLSP